MIERHEDDDIAFFRSLLTVLSGQDGFRKRGITAIKEAAEEIAERFGSPGVTDHILAHNFGLPLLERRLPQSKALPAGRPVNEWDLIAGAFGIELSPAPSVRTRMPDDPKIKVLK